ncbi:hypothetical protein ARMGADRAFT_1086338 [Armillaria gallica]|uniref:Uncharacterized protein n=1 Tax=Armillaria gallica TaxID=47427 RepID=A0A2H3DE01_ARMGA|nr:hypothetical protein ARMGADRAFT_1086338 [Armillaria gallica]
MAIDQAMGYPHFDSEDPQSSAKPSIEIGSEILADGAVWPTTGPEQQKNAQKNSRKSLLRNSWPEGLNDEYTEIGGKADNLQARLRAGGKNSMQGQQSSPSAAESSGAHNNSASIISLDPHVLLNASTESNSDAATLSVSEVEEDSKTLQRSFDEGFLQGGAPNSTAGEEGGMEDVVSDVEIELDDNSKVADEPPGSVRSEFADFTS